MNADPSSGQSLPESPGNAPGGVQDYRLIVESIPGLVFTMTAAGELEYNNQRLLDYFGRTQAELEAWEENDSVHPDDKDRVMRTCRENLAAGVPFVSEHRLRRSDGVYRWFHLRWAPVSDASGRLMRWYGAATDIDDLKRAEESLRTLQACFSRAAHLATLSELAGSLAHEINQPLAAIVANAHACHRWLTAPVPSVERAVQSAERIMRDANTAAEVVARVRSLFRQAPPTKQPLNINDVIREVCELMADDLRRRNVALHTELQRELPITAADRVQMQQLIANLVRNAIEAMDGVHDRPRELRITSLADGTEVTVQVEDCGVGLSQPDAMFDPFFTTKSSGMGMGLAICRSIVDAHGGRLSARQNSPHGATFSFALAIGGASEGDPA